MSFPQRRESRRHPDESRQPAMNYWIPAFTGMTNRRVSMNDEESVNVLEPKASAGFVETGFVKGLVQRALNYIKAGFPVHLRGISGTGKTTLAMHVASKIERPVVLIHGDDQLGTA